MLTLGDIVAEFRKYSDDHPLRLMSDICIDTEGNIIKDSLVQKAWALNSMTAVARPLQILAQIDERAYFDMVRNKLRAKYKQSFSLHGLISALCELSIMNTFICRSSEPNSFRYEDHVRNGSTKNVEFSIKMSDFLFHVEVKTSDLILEDNQIAKLLEEYPAVLLTDAQNEQFEDLQLTSDIPVRGSLARRIADYLSSANDKFGKTTGEKEVNLLVICWDDRYHIPLMALKSPKAQGLLTNKSFIIDKNGAPLLYDYVDCILVNGNYALFKEYVIGLLFKQFNPSYPVNPFFQVFTRNFIVDRNLTSDRVAIIKSIFQQDVIIVDEDYADQLKPISIATMKDEGTIRFL